MSWLGELRQSWREVTESAQQPVVNTVHFSPQEQPMPMQESLELTVLNQPNRSVLLAKLKEQAENYFGMALADRLHYEQVYITPSTIGMGWDGSCTVRMMTR